MDTAWDGAVAASKSIAFGWLKNVWKSQTLCGIDHQPRPGSVVNFLRQNNYNVSSDVRRTFLSSLFLQQTVPDCVHHWPTSWASRLAMQVGYLLSRSLVRMQSKAALSTWWLTLSSPKTLANSRYSSSGWRRRLSCWCKRLYDWYQKNWRHDFFGEVFFSIS